MNMTSVMVIDLNKNVEESENTSSSSNFNEIKKSCTDCHTTKTPCWRGGPAGPKTLCNACGIRHRKKTRTFVGGLDEERNISSSRRKIGKNSSSRSNNNNNNNKLKFGLRDKIGEEEQAAFLLMALSYGCISA